MGEFVTFPSNGGSCDGYLALPAGGSGPAVIVIQEWWGLVGHIKDVADRFAAAGFVALAPDLYHGSVATEPDEARKLLMEMQIQEAAKDIAGAAKYLTALPVVDSPSIGTVGFCMGGALAIWSATFVPSITAAVGFYPGGSWERTAPDWIAFTGKAAQIHCSESDGTASAPNIREAVEAIQSAGGEAEAFDYPGTHHAFFNDDRPEVFKQDAADLAWGRTVAFFNARLR